MHDDSDDDDDNNGTGSEANEVGTESSKTNCSSPPLTPLPPGLKRLQVTSSFESVSLLSDNDVDGGA